MDGIAQARALRYLAVNVYPSSTGWRVAVMVRDAGKPYPRLVSRISDIALPSDTHTLAEALNAASEALEQLAGDVRLD